jgi:hypothetical protein
MRCYICDVELTENEIQISEENKSKASGLPASEPCTTCQDVIFAAAYSDGFEPGTDNTKHEHASLLEVEEDLL